jgi:phosphohistidine phosphatase SixA
MAWLYRIFVIGLLFSSFYSPNVQASKNQASKPYENSSFTIYLTRHAEKTNLNDGNKNPELTAYGHQRAANIAMILQGVNLQRIYSTDYLRTLQTAEPTALSLNLPITSYNPRKLKEFAESLLNAKQTVLVVGHSNTTPQLVNYLGGNGASIDELTYGDLYQLGFKVHKNGVSKPIQQHLKVPPQRLSSVDKLGLSIGKDALQRIELQHAQFDMYFNDQLVGFYSQTIEPKQRLIQVTEKVKVDNLGVDATTVIAVDAQTIQARYLTTQGLMAEKKADIKLQFIQNQAELKVKGHSEINRQPFKPQGQLQIERDLPVASYERQSILALLPRLGLTQDQTFNWYNSFDDEVRQIHYDYVGEAVYNFKNKQVKVHKIAITGGAPSQLFYVEIDTAKVLQIDIIGTPWTYRLR